MKRQNAGRGFLVLSVLLMSLLLPSAPAHAQDNIGYKIVIEVREGTNVLEGVTQFVNDQFTIRQLPFGSLLYLTGRLTGPNALKVSGDWRGNYMSAEGYIVDGQFRMPFRVTGFIYSAFIALSFHPSFGQGQNQPPPNPQ